MKEKLIIVGIGGMAPEVIDFVKRYELFDIVAYAVDQKYMQNEYDGRPVYPLEELEKYVDKETVKLFIAISWYNYMNKYKRQKFENLKARGFHFANLISPLASVKTEKIGEGNWIWDFVEVGFNSVIGDNNTICAHSLFAHHSKMGNHNVLSGRATVAGQTVIGDQNYIGISATVFNKLTIGNKCLVGGGAIVKQNLGNYILVSQNDCKQYNLTDKTIEKFLSIKGHKLMSDFYQ